MAKNEFQIGDVVRLKSGGSKMVVDSVSQNVVSCVVWSDKDSKVIKAADNIDYALLEKLDK